MKEAALIHPGERLDDLQRCGYQLIQDEKRFCFGIDAVLLASFAKMKKGEKALDLGTGTGVIPLLMHARHRDCRFTGLEIQRDSADMAARSVQYNHLEDQVKIVEGDIRKITEYFPRSSFDVVTGNPPYMAGTHGLKNPSEALAIARHEVCVTLEEFTAAAAMMLGDKGRFYMVHRPNRLAEIMRALSRYQLEPKRMRLVYPYVDREPNLVLIEAVRGGKAFMTVEKPLIVYEAPGVYTQEVKALYTEN